MTHQRMLHAAFDLALRGYGWEDIQCRYPLLTDNVCKDVVKLAWQRRQGQRA